MKSSIFLIIFNAICSYMSNGQLIEIIWEDNMDNNNNLWTGHNDFNFAMSSSRCYSNSETCARVTALNGNSWIQRSTDITLYHSIQLQIDITGFDLETGIGDSCQIFYSYNGNEWNKSGDWANERYEKQNINFPQSSTANMLWIRLKVTGDSTRREDRCYWDNIILKGILYTNNPSISPTISPIKTPTVNPSNIPTQNPSKTPTNNPSNIPTKNPSATPTNVPSIFPTLNPSISPVVALTNMPSVTPTHNPSEIPSKAPTSNPTLFPSKTPSNNPSLIPSITPTNIPTQNPSKTPTNMPSFNPSNYPTIIPSKMPSNAPTANPSTTPTNVPTNPGSPTKSPSYPTNNPSLIPSTTPTNIPTQNPSKPPTNIPTLFPSKTPSNIPSFNPSNYPTINPSETPSNNPTQNPSNNPTNAPTNPGSPSKSPSYPTITPTNIPSQTPTTSPITNYPTTFPTSTPTNIPSNTPTQSPITHFPTTLKPTTTVPSNTPSQLPSFNPTINPTKYPTHNPSLYPTKAPFRRQIIPNPTAFASENPSAFPSKNPTTLPSKTPTTLPSHIPTLTPTPEPTGKPTKMQKKTPNTTHSNFEIFNISTTPILELTAVSVNTLNTIDLIKPGIKDLYKGKNKSAQFDDITLPTLGLAVLIGVMTFCSVSIVVLRKICVKNKAYVYKSPVVKELNKSTALSNRDGLYINGQNIKHDTMDNSNIKRGTIISPLQLPKCDSFNTYHSQIHTKQQIQQSLQPKSTHTVELVMADRMNGNNRINMSNGPKTQIKYLSNKNNNPPSIDNISTTDSSIEDTPKEKPHHHIYPTNTTITTTTSINLSALQNAVHNAKTSSQFDKVERMIEKFEKKQQQKQQHQTITEQKINEIVMANRMDDNNESMLSYDMSSTDTSIQFTETSVGTTAKELITQYNTIRNKNSRYAYF